MSTIITAVVSVTALGLICAVALTVASKLMAVPVDERLGAVRARLPGANCGACGYSGCDGYALALVDDDAELNLCSPGGEETIKQLVIVLGKESASAVKKAAVVHCMGDLETVRKKLEYNGIQTCDAARRLFGGESACSFGCVGLGDCAAACLYDAICVQNGLAHIDPRKCVGCGHCVKACPNALISVEQYSGTKAAVLCMNTEKGAALKDKCGKGCIGCMRCVKECPSGAVAVSDFLAKIDDGKCDGCGKCAAVCPKGCIVLVES